MIKSPLEWLRGMAVPVKPESENLYPSKPGVFTQTLAMLERGLFDFWNSGGKSNFARQEIHRIEHVVGMARQEKRARSTFLKRELGIGR